MTIGEKIKQARKKAGLTQQELANRLGIPYQGIGQYERGLRNPKISTVQKIADALGVSASELLPGEMLAKYEDYDILASEIRSSMIAEASTPEEWQEAVNTKTSDIQEDLLKAHYKRKRFEFVAAAFDCLNAKGQKNAVRYMQSLLNNPEYRAGNQEETEADVLNDHSKDS